MTRGSRLRRTDVLIAGIFIACLIVAVAAAALADLRLPSSPIGSPPKAPREVAVRIARPRLPQTVTAPRPVATRPPAPAVSERQSAPQSASGGRLVSSTAYCLTGTMKNGSRVFDGAVAVTGAALDSWAPMGSRWRVLSGPMAGRTFVVADRIGHGSEFDIAMPGRCGAALDYGRQSIRIAPA